MNQKALNTLEVSNISPEEIFTILSQIKSIEISEKGVRERQTLTWEVTSVRDHFELKTVVGTSQIPKTVWVSNLADLFSLLKQKERKIEKIHFKEKENDVEAVKDGVKSQVESTVESKEEKEGYTKILPTDPRKTRVSLVELFSYFPQVGDELVCKSSVFPPFDYVYVILGVKTGGVIIYQTKNLNGEEVSQPREISIKVFLESFSDEHKDVESVRAVYRKKETQEATQESAMKWYQKIHPRNPAHNYVNWEEIAGYKAHQGDKVEVKAVFRNWLSIFEVISVMDGIVTYSRTEKSFGTTEIWTASVERFEQNFQSGVYTVVAIYRKRKITRIWDSGNIELEENRGDGNIETTKIPSFDEYEQIFSPVAESSWIKLDRYRPQIGDLMRVRTRSWEVYIEEITAVDGNGGITFVRKSEQGNSENAQGYMLLSVILQRQMRTGVETLAIYRKKEPEQQETVPLSTLKTTSEIGEFFQTYQAQRGDQFTIKVGKNRKKVFTVTGFCANNQYVTTRMEDYGNTTVKPEKVSSTADASKISWIVGSLFSESGANSAGENTSVEYRRLDEKHLPYRINID